jgi:uncharacterized protein YciI
MPVFAVRYDYVNDEAGLDKHRSAHREFLRGLIGDGTLRASGPFAADGGSRGALLVFRGKSADGIRTMLASDPFATAGLIAHVDVREWTVVSGPVSGAIAEGS